MKAAVTRFTNIDRNNCLAFQSFINNYFFVFSLVTNGVSLLYIVSDKRDLLNKILIKYVLTGVKFIIGKVIFYSLY